MTEQRGELGAGELGGEGNADGAGLVHSGVRRDERRRFHALDEQRDAVADADAAGHEPAGDPAGEPVPAGERELTAATESLLGRADDGVADLVGNRGSEQPQLVGQDGHEALPLPAYDIGSGDAAIVLYPGFALTSRSYLRCAELIARHTRIVVPHIFEATSGLGRARWLDRVEATLLAHGIEHATHVGHSFGGAFALGIAARRPERIDRLVLVDSEGLSLRWTLARDALLGGRIRRVPTRASIDDFARTWARHPKHMTRMALWGFWARHDDEIEQVRTSMRPVDVLWAERDTLPNIHDGRRFAERIGARFHLVQAQPGEDPLVHNWPILWPERFVAELLRLELLPEAERATGTATMPPGSPGTLAEDA